MRTKYYYITIIILCFVLGCSKNDDDPVPPPATVESFDPVSIEFVHEDGTGITANDCITPDEAYAIQITTTKNSSGTTKVSKIEYTINGALYSMSFSEAGTKRNPIVLVYGRNVAELSSTGTSNEVNYIEQGEFELVN
ncbi:hypothetical protein [Flavivirga eckloniae]|uniref:Uncharacterized protein n=1 Tax=Flavivirga eckloniae TaxID=1803846 RepID=A0A2K9PW27_9FLAO|nr:hypothetical protein [Flavivirga eckloniae]AUP81275.1 hypothetical protein C1H87_22170 [Flavivirga eckloniae]